MLLRDGTGLVVSRLGFGAMGFGQGAALKHRRGDASIASRQNQRLRTAIDPVAAPAP